MSTDNKKFDSGKRMLMDEIGQMPLIFKMNGSAFRWKVFQMAYEMSHPKSLQQIVKTSNEIIDFVNNDHQLPIISQ